MFFSKLERNSEAGKPSSLEFTILVDKSSLIKREYMIRELRWRSCVEGLNKKNVVGTSRFCLIFCGWRTNLLIAQTAHPEFGFPLAQTERTARWFGNESVKNEQFWVWISKCLDSQDKNPTEEKWWAQESWWDSFCLGGCLMGWTDKNRNEKSRNSASRVLRNFVVQYCEFQTRWYLRFEISFSLLTHSRYHHCQCFFFF